MAKAAADGAAKPAYKKRVIVEESSDGEDAQPLPPVKRAKAEVTSSLTELDPTAPSSAVPAAAQSSAATAATPSDQAPPTNGHANGNHAKQQPPLDEDDKPLSKTSTAAKKKPASSSSKKSAPANNDKMDFDDDEDDAPLATTKKSAAAKKAAAKKAAPSKKKKDDSDADDDFEQDDDDDDLPLAAAAPVKGKAKAKAKPKAKKDDEDKPVKEKAAAKPRAKKVKADDAEVASPKKAAAKGKGKAKKEGAEGGDPDDGGDSDGSEVYRWWDEGEGDGTKWKTLEHNGVLFPPEYEPHGVKMLYGGEPVDLGPRAEEVASFFAALLESDYPNNPVFVKNFFDSWVCVMLEEPPLDGTKIKSFAKCDFRPIFEHLDAERLRRKNATAAEKKVIKAARDILEEPYKTCLLDGRKEKMGNFRVEPPGLFRGRGEHPKTGLLKTRLRAEDISINISKGAKVPEAPPGHEWKSVVHDDKVTWLATWHENINNAVKYVFLAPGSSLKGQSDFKKFEKARNLKNFIEKIRTDYTKDFKDEEMVIRQRATAIYFIDRLALRNGNEKGEDEADTVGCCSLRFEHITLTPPTTVTFDFLGKDSIRYVNEVKVDEIVFKNLKIFKKSPKEVGDLLFDRLNTGLVNKYLAGYMTGLTAKVFRTYNASQTFVDQLASTPQDASLADKLLAYNRANRMVAVLCNHQKTVSKGHGSAMEKAVDKLRGVKYQRMKLRKTLFSEHNNRRKYAQYLDDESDLDDDWIDQHQVTLLDAEKERIRKKFEKENKKLAEENEPIMGPGELVSRLADSDTFRDKLAEEKAAGWSQSSNLSDAKIIAAIEKIDARIEVQKISLLDKDEGKEISLGTSKMNYLDPRITFAWCKKHDVPAAKLFPKTLIEKFTWAAEVEADFEW